ncbi:hypothetical protein RchiOBHm_Chr7g0222111 [Rosa chinensis]|uniref:Uncharacterized protein n=1 Tax=Rosa chinensis TaxID=74649 RepID=A0A2P6PD72_ROSCH|nr:hypothetical protein RchiOBHm_Chr7g0222111 [Rosa chinensis]
MGLGNLRALGEKTHERPNQEICLYKSVNFDRSLRVAQNELDDDLYIIIFLESLECLVSRAFYGLSISFF